MNQHPVSYLNAQRGSGGSIAVHNATLLVNQELGEVPFDTIAKNSAFARLQELVQGGSIAAIDVNLTDDRS